MRLLFDTNIYISYLLPSTQKGVINAILEGAFEGRFTLLVAQEIIDEFSRKISTKEYLARRIEQADAEELISLLRRIAEVIPTITPGIMQAIPNITRDAKDDYLLAYALVGRADYLVTGDNDLLSLGEVARLRIVRPSDFLKILSSEQPTNT
jgi:putative PIN family toxin of toxin-antitoxin system